MSSASRSSFYAETNKATRAMIGSILSRAGSTDFTDPVEVAGLRGAMRAAFDLITARAEREDRVLGPLLRRHAPASALEITCAHSEHRSRMRRLIARIADAEWRRDGTPHALVVALARFAADLGALLADQEEIAMPALEAALSPEDLAEAVLRLDQAAPLEERLAWLRWTLPAISHPERVARLRALRAEPEIYPDAVAIALAVLDPDARARLEIALSLQPPARAA